MNFHALTGGLIDDAAAAEVLLAIGNTGLLARVNEVSACYGETAGTYAGKAVRRFADGASHEEWLSLMTALSHAADPAATCTLRAVAWALERDDIGGGIEEGLAGALIYEESAAVNALMSHCADELISAGFRPGGLIQTNHDPKADRRCDMTLRELMSGEVVQVSEDRGQAARGCRLDHDAFTFASQLCAQALAQEPDIMLVNKFGKLEAQGKGLRHVIADALLAGIPVLIGLPHRNLTQFESFIGGPYRQLTAAEVQSWCRRQIAARRHGLRRAGVR